MHKILLLLLLSTSWAWASPPNIVLFYVDDMGFGDVRVYGNEDISTPHLDQMAADGVRFTQFYSPSPVCTPSRAGMLTGRLPVRYGMAYGVFFPDATTGLPTEEVTLAEVLKPAGYASGLFGKWHLGHQKPYLPLRQGFDEFNGTPFSNDMVVNVRMEGDEIVDLDPDQKRFTRGFTEAAIDFIERHHDRPFLALINHPMPHVPLFVSGEFENHTGKGIYADVIAEIDWSVGAVRDALERLAIQDNTLVFFTSDNGPWLSYVDHGGSAAPLREGKFTTFEGGMRVPALAVWPGTIAPGRTEQSLFSALDLLPTVAALANAQLADDVPLDGYDLSAMLTGQDTAATRNEMPYYARNRLDAFRLGDWKIKLANEGQGLDRIDIGWPGSHPPHDVLLFNLANDPGETTNLAKQEPENWRKCRRP